jgi:hypothetical protein
LNTPIPKPVALCSPQTISTSVECASCGYVLLGLDANGKCPECGTPIDRSLRGDLLQFAKPSWVTRVALGATVLCAACWMSVGLLTLAISVSLSDPLAILVFNLGGTCVSLGGAWLLSSRPPRRSFQVLGEHSRALARVLPCLALVADVVLLANLRLLFWNFPAVLIPRFYLLAAWTAAVSACIESLALSLPSERLRRASRRLRSCAVALALTMTAYWLFVVAEAGLIERVVAGLSPKLRTYLEAFLILLLIAWEVLTPVVLLIFMFLFLDMMTKARAELRKSADAAKQNWATDGRISGEGPVVAGRPNQRDENGGG